MVQDWFKEQQLLGFHVAFKFSSSQSNLKHVWDVWDKQVWILEGHTSHLPQLKEHLGAIYHNTTSGFYQAVLGAK